MYINYIYFHQKYYISSEIRLLKLKDIQNVKIKRIFF